MKGFNSSNASSYIQNINISETNTHKTSIAFTELMSAESEISLPTLSASTYGSPNSLDCSSSDIPSSESPLPCLKSLFPPFQDLGPSDVGRSQKNYSAEEFKNDEVSCKQNEGKHPRRPEAKYKIRTLGLAAALLPGLGCYLCLFYSFLFQRDRVMNFTTTNCPSLMSAFPAVSYSIGVWYPQKFLWLFILSFSLPARFFYAIVYRHQFRLGQSENRQRPWFPKMIKAQMYLLFLEAFGLLSVSIIDIKSNFFVHAVCYAIWLTSFNFSMLFSTILHHHSGMRQITKEHGQTFYVKCFLFITGYPLSVSTAVSYITYAILCSSFFYAMFSIAEYILVGYNSAFYFLMIWELSGSKVEVYIRHNNRITRNDISIT